MNSSRTHLKPAADARKGVALVITLIFLSLITFMAVTFLVVSRHGAEQTTTSTTQIIAKMAADQALQRAEGQTMALMLANSNGFNLPLQVSTNYSPGFDIGIGGPSLSSITNVGYQYANNGVLTGVPLKPQHLQIMLNNLLILPRPPVFITTNKAVNPEFRYFVNGNRNHDSFGNDLFDNTGLVPLVVSGVTNGFTNVVGDPQWVGILDHPDQRHSASNQFVARYAFIALPIGNSLDINYIHNDVKNPVDDGFLRDQGVGSWEINLAGFLNGLNPNKWNYQYDNRNNIPSSGFAFDDAAAILQYRYNGNYNTLSSFENLYGRPASLLFSSDLIDGYSVGPLMTSLSPTGLDPDGGLVNRPWSGADNTNQFFSDQDLFNSAAAIPALAGFTNRMITVGSDTTNTFNEYTFYRMLAQLSFGSAPDPANKLDLNYVNVGGIAATNFIPWTPVQFFTNAADRLLRSRPEFATNGIPFGFTNGPSITNIPVYPVNFYTPAVHRMLQLAANIYDAGVNKNANGSGFDYPSVFRPIFAHIGTNIYISGYEEVTNVSQVTSAPLDALRVPSAAALVQPRDNIYGIPLVIGAKKGFPNFNEFSMQSTITVTRKVEIDKGSPGNPNRAQWMTNIQYILGISNAVAVETWNSYRSNYSRSMNILGANTLAMVLTNENGTVLTTNLQMPMALAIPATGTNIWAGFISSQNTNVVSASFRMPLYTNINFLPDSIFHANGYPIHAGERSPRLHPSRRHSPRFPSRNSA